MIALIVTLAIAVAYIFRKKQKKREYLLNYIVQAKSKGYSREQVEKILAEKGIPMEEVRSLAEIAYKPIISRANSKKH